jgi:hypothetical protein
MSNGAQRLERFVVVHRHVQRDASSSDGQFFQAGGFSRDAGRLNAHYGHKPGFKVYTHISDRCPPFYSKLIASTASRALHVLNALLYHQSDVATRRHHMDGGGDSDHVFALCTLLGFQLTPRIPDLKHRPLYSFDKPSAYPILEPLIAGRIHPHGEIRDRTYENQQHRASGLNFVVTAIVLRNTRYLERAVAMLRKSEEAPRFLAVAAGLGACQSHPRLHLGHRTGGVGKHRRNEAAAGSLRSLPQCRLTFRLCSLMRNRKPVLYLWPSLLAFRGCRTICAKLHAKAARPNLTVVCLVWRGPQPAQRCARRESGVVQLGQGPAIYDPPFAGLPGTRYH